MEKIECSVDKNANISLEVNLMDYLQVSINDGDKKLTTLLDKKKAIELRDSINQLLKKVL